jgi:hypothetical protein
MNGTSAFTTCRVISLVHTDYGGRATELLKALVDDPTRHSLPPPFFLGQPSSSNHNLATDDDFHRSLEYRTLFCLARLVSSAFLRLNATDENRVEFFPHPPEDDSARYSTRAWRVEHVKWSEGWTLRQLQSHVQNQIRNQFGSIGEKESNPGYFIRREPCPREYLDPLFEQFGTARV